MCSKSSTHSQEPHLQCRIFTGRILKTQKLVLKTQKLEPEKHHSEKPIGIPNRSVPKYISRNWS